MTTKTLASLTITEDEAEFISKLEDFLAAASILKLDADSWVEGDDEDHWNYSREKFLWVPMHKGEKLFVTASVSFQAWDSKAELFIKFPDDSESLVLETQCPPLDNGGALCAHMIEAARQILAFAKSTPVTRSDFGTLRGTDPEPWVLAAQILAVPDPDISIEELYVTLPSPWSTLQATDWKDLPQDISEAAHETFCKHSPAFCAASFDYDYDGPEDALYLRIGSTFNTAVMFQKWNDNPVARMCSIRAAYLTGVLEGDGPSD